MSEKTNICEREERATIKKKRKKNSVQLKRAHIADEVDAHLNGNQMIKYDESEKNGVRKRAH